MPDYVKFPLVLVIVTLISAAALAYIYDIAKPKIDAQEEKKTIEAEKIVFPEGDKTSEKKTVNEVTYKEVLKNNECIGYVVEGEAPGYSSTIRVMVGVTEDFVVKGVKILSQKETPGLGTKVEEVQSDKTWLLILSGKRSFGKGPDEEDPLPWFPAQYRGLTREEIKLTRDGGKVDAITGATISSRAVTDAVRGAVEALNTALGKAQ